MILCEELLRIRFRLERDNAAPVVTYDRRTFDPKRIHEIDHILREYLTCHTNSRFVGLAESAGVRSEHCIMLRKRAQLMSPTVRGFGESMNQHHRLAGPALQVVHSKIRSLNQMS